MVENGTKVMMEGVSIIFRNFSGEEGQYNKEGNRNFGVLLPKETAEAMEADEWNVKWLTPRDEDGDEDEAGEKQGWLPVAVKFDVRPPKIVMVTSRGRTQIKEDGIGMFDWADITNVDLIVRAYVWDVNGKTGVKAYVQSMYVTIEEDELEKKYAEMDAQ